MPLSIGEKLGHYEILSLLGKGGMGEVYKAHDPRLRRDVAIKVSAARFNERFEREAHAIAALNHPNICTLYDIGPDYLVMELVEGSSPKGPLPLDEALRIAGQIAAALEAAHEKGIVHRDLKPANVKITPGGLVKVLDFGLAKIVRKASPDGSTVTMGLTEAGSALGTPAYMAPEQAQGNEVDRRADVWAFGVLLYELLTGHRAFKGDSVQATLAAVLTKEPPLDKLPPRVRRLLRACLKKDPRERLSNIGDWRFLLDELLDEDAPVQAAPARRSWVPWAIAVVGVALGGFGLYRFTSAGTGTSSLISFNVPIPGGGGAEAMFALSPDGQNLAIASPEKGQIHLWVRPLDGLEARLLPGAEGARYPFWSPDGKQIGFFADGKLKKVSPGGGDPTVVADVGMGVDGGTWGSQGVIVFAIDNGLFKVEETGGNPVSLAQRTGSPRNPEFLPDGRHFLYANRDGGIQVSSLDGVAPKQILPDFSRAVYADGNLLFRRQGRLVAQPFDAATLTASGAAVPVTKEIVINSPQMRTTVLFSVAGSRVLAYQAQVLEQLVWVDRTGTMKEKVGPPNEWANFRLSPDQNKIAMDISIFQGADSGRDVALFDLVRGTQERLTSDPEADLVPIFSPRGDRIVFTSRRMGRFNPFITSAPNQEKLVVDLGMPNGYPLDWSPDEKHILWWMDGDLWIVPVSGSEKPYAYVHTRFDEHDGVFSPDGHWVTYVSNESGRNELYLESFGADARKRYTVSSQGGTGPAWRRDGKELFFVAGDGRLTAVPVTMNGADVQLGRAESLFPVSPTTFFHRAYEVSKDGQQFLIATPAQAGGAAITVVLNWQAGLKK
jgi:eukaryotic-like serine/threonine-protein kinase